MNREDFHIIPIPLERGRKTLKVPGIGVVFGVGIFLSGCAFLGKMVGHVGVRPPTAEVVHVRVFDLAFDRATLLFQIAVVNPNDVGLRLSGFEYRFVVNGKPFVQGVQDRETEIAAHTETLLELPLTFLFDDVYRLYVSLKEADTAPYELTGRLRFRVPVLGDVHVPFRRAGTFPLIKRPDVYIEALRIKRLALVGAELGLTLRVINPNAFSVFVEKVYYEFKVDGKTWINGTQTTPTSFAAKGEGFLEMDLRFNFLQMSVAVSRTLLDRKPLPYDLEGSFELKTSLPMFERATLPFRLRGNIQPTE